MVIRSYIFTAHSSCKPWKCMQLKACFVHFELLSTHHPQMAEAASVQRNNQAPTAAASLTSGAVSHDNHLFFPPCYLPNLTWEKQNKSSPVPGPRSTPSCQFLNHSLCNAADQRSARSTLPPPRSDLGYWGIVPKSRSRGGLTGELRRMTAW